jgi:hypothetical protein
VLASFFVYYTAYADEDTVSFLHLCLLHSKSHAYQVIL